MPINVLFVGHGNEDDGPAFGTKQWSPLFPGWNGLTPKDTPDVLKKAIWEGQASKLLGAKGYIREMTFTNCSIANSEVGRSLLDIISKDLGALIRAFKEDAAPGVIGDNNIAVYPHLTWEQGGPKSLGEFIYVTGGADKVPPGK